MLWVNGELGERCVREGEGEGGREGGREVQWVKGFSRGNINPLLTVGLDCTR